MTGKKLTTAERAQLTKWIMDNREAAAGLAPVDVAAAAELLGIVISTATAKRHLLLLGIEPVTPARVSRSSWRSDLERRVKVLEARADNPLA
jgi:predicted nicotinamide N-methyase